MPPRMPPSSLAILIGAGPTSGAGIARVLGDPARGNMAVALLARNEDKLTTLATDLRDTVKGGVFHAFPTNTEPASLTRAFSAIAAHPDLKGLKLRLAIYHIKHSSKKPFLEETAQGFGESLETYVTGAFAFVQEALRMMYAQNGGQTALDAAGEGHGRKKGTIILTGTLGALRTNVGYAAYGATRAGARSVAQAVAREHSKFGVQCVHAIANGGIVDDEGSDDVVVGKKMSGESVGETYLWLARQPPSLWVHELDLRPAMESF
jgi:NAD(P)-dependent dehydrogenase (short-subunit alcohol dehydrogenase family)